MTRRHGNLFAPRNPQFARSFKPSWRGRLTNALVSVADLPALLLEVTRGTLGVLSLDKELWGGRGTGNQSRELLVEQVGSPPKNVTVEIRLTKTTKKTTANHFSCAARNRDELDSRSEVVRSRKDDLTAQARPMVARSMLVHGFRFQ